SVRDTITGAVTSYQYSGGRFDWQSGRFLGFAWARTTKPCNAGETLCPYTETRYGLDPRFPSKPLEVTEFAPTPRGPSRVVRPTLYGYTHAYGASNVPSPFRSDLTSELVEELDDANQRRSTLRTRSYDRYGNITVDTDHGLFFDSTAPNAFTGGDDRRF